MKKFLSFFLNIRTERSDSETIGTHNSTHFRHYWSSARSILPVILIVALLYVFSATGCGKKGPPVPPVDKRKPVKEESRLHRPAEEVLSNIGLSLQQGDRLKKGRILSKFRHFSSF
jgi:predicted small lipoprotein YifL